MTIVRLMCGTTEICSLQKFYGMSSVIESQHKDTFT